MFPFSLYDTVKRAYTERNPLGPVPIAERYYMLNALERAIINPDVERFMALIAEANRKLHPEQFRAHLAEEVAQFREEFAPLIRLMGMDDERLEASIDGAPAWYFPYRRIVKCRLCVHYTRLLHRRMKVLMHESAYDLIPLDEFNSAVWETRVTLCSLYAMSILRVAGIDLSAPASRSLNSIVGVWSNLLSVATPA